METRESLRNWIARESPLPVSRAASVARRVAEAVAARHAKGFSAATALDPEAMAISADPAGDLSVELPPPVPGDAAVSADPAEDMPRLGAVLYELFAGVVPPARRAPPPIQRARPDLPEPLADLVIQCFHPGPAGQPGSAEEVARRLAPFEAAPATAPLTAAVLMPPSASTSPPPPPSTETTRATPVLAPLRLAPLRSDAEIAAATTRPVPSRPELRARPTPEPPRRPPPATPMKPLEDRTLARGSEPPDDEPRPARPIVIFALAAALLAATAAAFWIVIETTGPSRTAAHSIAAPRRPTSVPPAAESRATALPVAEVSPPPAAATPFSAETPAPARSSSTEPIAATAPPPGLAATAQPHAASDEQALREAFDEWIASTNRRDISGHMRFYMPRVATFYLAHDVSRDFVWEEKSRLFAAGRVEVSASTPEIQLAPDGRSATLRFRKRYVEPGRGGERRGEVLQEMRWVRTPRGWRIAAERDAKQLSRQ